MRAPLASLAIVLAAGCASPRAQEDWSGWYAEGAAYDVQEPIAFTDVPYAFPTDGPGVAGLPVPDAFQTAFAPDDDPVDGCADWTVTDELPVEVEGIVTIHPRFYFKGAGCQPSDREVDADSDEKFYGSYFLQDGTGGIFVLGDSKVAHFDMGDRVRMRVRAVRNRFDLVAVAVHDIVEVERGPEPIYYQVDEDGFGPEDVSIVKRITGTVISDPDTFGEFQVEGDDGQIWSVGLDQELSRRGVRYAVGERIQATGPILYSFSVYSMVILRVGQITVLDPA